MRSHARRFWRTRRSPRRRNRVTASHDRGHRQCGWRRGRACVLGELWHVLGLVRRRAVRQCLDDAQLAARAAPDLEPLVVLRVRLFASFVAARLREDGVHHRTEVVATTGRKPCSDECRGDEQCESARTQAAHKLSTLFTDREHHLRILGLSKGIRDPEKRVCSKCSRYWRLPDDVVRRLEAALPPSFVDLFRRFPTLESPPHRIVPGPRHHSLATGKPGSLEPSAKRILSVPTRTRSWRNQSSRRYEGLEHDGNDPTMRGESLATNGPDSRRTLPTLLTESADG